MGEGDRYRVKEVLGNRQQIPHLRLEATGLGVIDHVDRFGEFAFHERFSPQATSMIDWDRRARSKVRNDKPNPTRIVGAEAVLTDPPGERASGIIAFAVVLTLLYLGRDILIPLALALMLSLLLAPLVRGLRRFGLAQGPSVWIAVLT